MTISGFVQSKWFRGLRWALWLLATVAFVTRWITDNHATWRTGMIAFFLYFCITIGQMKFGTAPDRFVSPIPQSVPPVPDEEEDGGGIAQ
jgi:hypothetical protein